MKETELQNTSEASKTEVQNLSAQDTARKHSRNIYEPWMENR